MFSRCKASGRNIKNKGNVNTQSQIKSNQTKSNQIKSNQMPVGSPFRRRWLLETYLICTRLYKHQGAPHTHNADHFQRLQNWMRSSVRCSQGAVSRASTLPANGKINLTLDISTISAAKKKKHIPFKQKEDIVLFFTRTFFRNRLWFRLVSFQFWVGCNG